MPSRSGEPVGGVDAGASRLGCLLVLLLLALAGYAAVRVVESEMDYRAVQEVARQQVGLAATRTDDEIRRAVLEKVEERDLPRSARNVRVRRLSGDRVVVSLAWMDTVEFFGHYQWVRRREVRVPDSR